MDTAIPPDYQTCLRRGIAYIEQHIDRDFALADVAHAAGLSQWHFQRIIRAATGETLKAYIRSRRLAASLRVLRDPKMPINAIARVAGFDNREDFTRAFRKVYQMTPARYRRIGNASLFPAESYFEQAYLERVRQRDAITPDLQQWPEKQVVGLRTSVYDIDSGANNVAQRLPALWINFLERIGEIAYRLPLPGEPINGMRRPVGVDTEQLQFMVCVPVTGESTLPPGMVSVTLPAGRRACFAHRGPGLALNHTINLAYSKWLLTSGEQHSGGWDIEIYGDQYHPHQPDSVMHYAMPLLSRAGVDPDLS